MVWAAGQATVSSSADDANAELATLRALLSALRTDLPRGPGTFFLTSSAGGVYAGSAHPPFDDATVPAALSPYGELKLQQESIAREHLMGLCPVVIGRIGNLFGPGQNLAKLQGLISRLAIATATQQPLNIFVPLDTTRDYIYVDDAAEMIRYWIDDSIRAQPDSAIVRVIASGESVTIGQLISTMRLVTKRRVPTALGSHHSSSNQVRDLRLVPSTAEGLTIRQSTPLPVGMKSVYLDILRRLQLASPTEPVPHAPH